MTDPFTPFPKNLKNPVSELFKQTNASKITMTDTSNSVMPKNFEESMERLKRGLNQSYEEIKMFWTKELMNKSREDSESMARGHIERSKQMTDTKKLTGREAVIALMEGKTLSTNDALQGNSKIKFIDGEVQRLGEKIPSPAWNINYILQKDWELVPEPMVEEWVATVQEMVGGGGLIEVGNHYVNKRVKVRVEVIL